MLKAAIGRVLVFSSLCICLLFLTACTRQSDARLPVLEDYDNKITQEDRTILKMGVVNGPYVDMFTEIVEPLFAQKGYSIELVTYDNYIDPNFALASGEIDLNVFQHYKYLNNFKIEYDLNLSAISEVPTALMGVYSHKYSALDNVETGAVIAIPDDSTNLSRALEVLGAAGIISVDVTVDSSKLTLKDITKNHKRLQFVPLEAHMLCEALNAYDMAVINGNFAIDGGLRLSDALFNETLSNHEYINVIAIRTNDMGRPFVTDLIAVLHSDEYKSAILDDDDKYSHFQYPCNFSDYSN